MPNLRQILALELGIDVLVAAKPVGAMVDEVTTHTIVISALEKKEKNPLILVWRDNYRAISYKLLKGPQTKKEERILHAYRKITDAYSECNPGNSTVKTIKERSGIDISCYVENP